MPFPRKYLIKLKFLKEYTDSQTEIWNDIIDGLMSASAKSV
jgi:hypothetical protein